MSTDILYLITQNLERGSWLTFLLVFWGAAILSLTSCTVVRIPVVIGYVGGLATSRKKAFLLTLSFVSALVLSYTLLGVMFGLISGIAAVMVGFSRYFYYLMGAVALFMGAQMVGLTRFNFFRQAMAKLRLPEQRGMAGAFLFGIIFALFESPTCPVCGPILFMIAGLTFAKGKILYAVLLFFTYALGQSLPLLLFGTFTSIIKFVHAKIEKVEGIITIAGGNILITLAVYFFLLG